ncbi:hypothetical protein ACFLQK_00675 [bacterium]
MKVNSGIKQKNRRHSDRKTVIRFLFTLAAFSIMASGCAKYAPVVPAAPPPPPKEKLLNVVLYTRADITYDFYYYIAIDYSEDPASFGPQPDFTTIDVAENWDYYIRFNKGTFTENYILSQNDIFNEPGFLIFGTPRYYTTRYTANSISFMIYLDELKAGAFDMKFNFITSREPLKDEYDIPDADVLVDWLKNTTETTFSISNTVGEIVRLSDYPLLNKTVSEEEDYPADITNWTVEITDI